MNEIVAATSTDVSLEYFLENYPDVMKIIFAFAVGILLGIEREWSQKPAGLRTFTIITTIATVMVIAEEPILLALGGALVVIQGTVFAVRAMLEGSDNYLLTTSASMVLAYGIGILIGKGQYQVGVLVAIFTSLLLVLRRELHGFARNLSKDEIQSALEFGVLAFVVFPLLPNESFGPSGAINPRTVWMLVVAVSAIGFANYLIVQRYGAKGIAITSFFGGLVNSAAVIGEIVSRTRSKAAFSGVAVGAILLANAAMAFRDMLIVIAFVPELAVNVGAPLITIIVVGIVLSYFMSDWDVNMDIEFESPFNLRTALQFGALFLLVLLLSASVQAAYGTSAFLVSSFLSGMVSSGAVTTSVVVLASSGQLSPTAASGGIIAAVSGSILVKLGLVITMDRSIARPVTIATACLLAAGVVGTWATAYLLT